MFSGFSPFRFFAVFFFFFFFLVFFFALWPLFWPFSGFSAFGWKQKGGRLVQEGSYGRGEGCGRGFMRSGEGRGDE